MEEMQWDALRRSVHPSLSTRSDSTSFDTPRRYINHTISHYSEWTCRGHVADGGADSAPIISSSEPGRLSLLVFSKLCDWGGLSITADLRRIINPMLDGKRSFGVTCLMATYTAQTFLLEVFMATWLLIICSIMALSRLMIGRNMQLMPPFLTIHAIHRLIRPTRR